MMKVLKKTKCRCYIGLLLAASFGISAPEVKGAKNFPPELQPMVNAIRQAGYQVLFTKSPVAGSYGATNTRKKIIWVAPISFVLGIGRQTLIHEAVHAAQSCPTGKMTLIGWNLPMDPVVDRTVAGILYRSYPHKTFDIEREAFAMQGHPHAIPMVIAALKKRCK